MTVKNYNSLIDEMKELADRINKHYDTVTLETVEELDTPATETQRILNELKDKGVLTEEDLCEGYQVYVKSPKAKSGWIAQGQPHKTEEDAKKDAESFSPEVTKVVKEGYQTMPPIDKERYTEIPDLEGPFMTLSGKVVYYDPKEGKYYDRDSDMYLDYDEWKAYDSKPDWASKED